MKLDKLLACDTGHNVSWWIRGRVHSVHYGKQVKNFVGPDADIRAAHEYGECIAHSLNCEGAFDNE